MTYLEVLAFFDKNNFVYAEESKALRYKELFEWECAINISSFEDLHQTFFAEIKTKNLSFGAVFDNVRLGEDEFSAQFDIAISFYYKGNKSGFLGI